MCIYPMDPQYENLGNSGVAKKIIEAKQEPWKSLPPEIVDLKITPRKYYLIFALIFEEMIPKLMSMFLNIFSNGWVNQTTKATWWFHIYIYIYFHPELWGKMNPF